MPSGVAHNAPPPDPTTPSDAHRDTLRSVSGHQQGAADACESAQHGGGVQDASTADQQQHAAGTAHVMLPKANGMDPDGLWDSSAHSRPHVPPPSCAHGHARSTSGLSAGSVPSVDFEQTGQPLTSSWFGDHESMLPLTSSLSYRDPSREVVLRVEAIVEREARVIVTLSRIIVTIALVVLLSHFILKLQKDDGWFIQNHAIYIINVSFGGLLLLVTLAAVFACGRRMLKAKWSGKRWSRRRLFFSSATFVQLVIQAVSLVFFLLPNAYILANDCAWFDGVVIWSGVVRWECWASMFIVFDILAHAANPWTNPAAPKAPGVMFDAPFWPTHWWKFGLLLVFSACNITAGAILQHDHSSGLSVLQPPVGEGNISSAHQCRGQEYDCSLATSVLTLASISIALLLLFLGLWIYFITRAYRRILRLNYADNRLANISIRIQIRNKGYPVVFFVVALVLLFYVHLNSCASYVESWVGMLAPQIVMTVTSILGCFNYMPRDPDLVNPILQVWLQEFAWSEKGRQLKLQARERMAEHVPQLLSEPIFCFETAVRMLYWSIMVYRYESETLKDSAKLYSLDKAMKLYDLDSFELLWERREDTKVLLAWNADRMVMSFRGTASFVNVLADLQFWLSSHPPSRGRGSRYLGTHPAVHAGFLRSWLANGLNKRVIQRLEEIIDQGGKLPDGVQRKIMLTGHSLGGALAHLAAYDIAKAFPSVVVRCYTFGSPRVGNHPFAKDYSSTVPDSWAVINGQDVVTRGAKFGVYKRCGHRVFIGSSGNILVRPSFSEISLRQMSWGASARNHLLASYKGAMVAIMLRQFDKSKGFKDGMQGVLELMETINIVRSEDEGPKTAREAEFAAKLATLAGLGGLAAGRVAGATAEAAGVVSGVADAAASAVGHAVLDTTSAVYHCVQPADNAVDDRDEEEAVGRLHSLSRRSLGGVAAPEPPIVEPAVPSRRGWLPRSRHNLRTSGESAREPSQRSASGPASRRSLGPGSRHSMASATSAAGSHGSTPNGAPRPGEIRSSGTYRRAAPVQSTQSAPVAPHLSEHAASADHGAPPGQGGSDSGGNDSSGTHHGSDTGRQHHRANSLPEGLLPGGADIERGITYEGGLRHHTGEDDSDIGQTEVIAEGHWPGDPASMASALCTPLHTH